MRRNTPFLLFSIFFCLFFVTGECKKRKDHKDLPSTNGGSLSLLTTRTSTRAARVRPEDKDDNHYCSPTISTGEQSLADRFARLSNSKDTDFLDRLRAEEESQAIAVQGQRPTIPLIWPILASSALLLISANFLSPTTLWHDLGQAVVAAMSVTWLPWMWIRPDRSAVSDGWMYWHAFGNPETIDYLYEHILPKTVTVFRKILVAELWNRFWSVAWKEVSNLFGASPNKKERNNAPAWMTSSHSFLVTTIQRGTKKVFQSALQKHFQTSMVSLFEFGTKTLRNQAVLLMDAK